MSTPTLAQVRAWQPGTLGTAATGVEEARALLDGAVGRVSSTMDDLQVTWSGDAAAMGDERAGEERRTGLRLVDALETARTALRDGAADLTTAKQNVLAKVSDAEGRGFRVFDDGTVTPPTLPPVMTAPGEAADALAERNAEQERLNEEAQTVAEGLSRALQAAGEADAAVAADLSAVEFPQSLEAATTAYLDRLLATADPLAALGTTAAGAVALAASLKNVVKGGTKAYNLAQFLRYSSRPITDIATFTKNMKAADAALDALRVGPANGGLARFVAGSRAARLAGRAFLPLTVVTGGIDVVTGGGYDGARGWATRGFAAGGVAGATALLLASSALGPVGLGIAGAAVIGYGLWSAGNYVYDNWDNITEFTSNAAGWLGDRADEAYGAVSDAAGEARDWAGDRLDEAGEALSDTADAVRDAGKSALQTASFGLFG